ncbi:hypothetical protein [Nonomuraea sp. NPDC049625]|uniref:hypothetical protein n=1 Tax=Nonomuraea sp. NPDC049625 TaxID=3155775 RepID=UPI003446EA92
MDQFGEGFPVRFGEVLQDGDHWLKHLHRDLGRDGVVGAEIKPDDDLREGFSSVAMVRGSWLVVGLFRRCDDRRGSSRVKIVRPRFAAGAAS